MGPAAFLQAIREHPDDDLHRLAWADWLEEQGEGARADFLRAQLRLAQLPEDDPARDPLLDESDDLLAHHEAEWVGPLRDLALEWHWHRGCIEHVTVWADTLLTRGEELFALAPIRSLRLLAEAHDFPRLAGWADLASIEHLDLGLKPPPGGRATAPFFRDRALLPLFLSPHLGRLRSVRLSGLGIEGTALMALIERGLFARLERLDLNDCHSIGDRMARQLAGTRADSLRSLHLLGTNLTTLGAQALFSAPAWPAMAELEVNAGLFFARTTSSAGISTLLNQPLLPQLGMLYLSGVVLDRVDLDRLLSANHLGPLRELRLINCRLSADDAVTLAESPSLRGLRRLELKGNLLFDEGARQLARSPYLTALQALDLSNNHLGGPGLRAIVRGRMHLTELSLSGNYIGDEGAALLAEKISTRLTHLSLEGANLGREAARHLAGSPRLSRMRVLRLGSNRLRNEGVIALASSPHLRRLRELDLSSNDLDSPGVEALLESLALGPLRQLGLLNSSLSPVEQDRLRARFGPGVAL